jgi:hypothetical protein
MKTVKAAIGVILTLNPLAMPMARPNVQLLKAPRKSA